MHTTNSRQRTPRIPHHQLTASLSTKQRLRLTSSHRIRPHSKRHNTNNILCSPRYTQWGRNFSLNSFHLFQRRQANGIQHRPTLRVSILYHTSQLNSKLRFPITRRSSNLNS